VSWLACYLVIGVVVTIARSALAFWASSYVRSRGQSVDGVDASNLSFGTVVVGMVLEVATWPISTVLALASVAKGLWTLGERRRTARRLQDYSAERYSPPTSGGDS
jgi:hypothetical protein